LTVVSAHSACVCRGCPCALFCLYALVAHAVTFGITCVCTTRRCPNMSGLCSVILVLLLNISQVSAICASRLSCALSSVFVCPHALLVKCACGCSWCRRLPCVRVVYVLPRCMAVYGIVCAHAFVCLVYLQAVVDRSFTPVLNCTYACTLFILHLPHVLLCQMAACCLFVFVSVAVYACQ